MEKSIVKKGVNKIMTADSDGKFAGVHLIIVAINCVKCIFVAAGDCACRLIKENGTKSARRDKKQLK